MNVLAKVSTYAKAVASALAAGGTALGVAIADGGFSTGDGVSVVLAVLGALGITYVVPNKPADEDKHAA
jgi:hypothetical protein